MEICLGGPNLSVFDECLVVDELSQGCTGICVAFNASNLGVSRCIQFSWGTDTHCDVF